jgi:hypothetical protein
MPFAGPALTGGCRIDDLLVRGLEGGPDDLALVSAKTRMSWWEVPYHAALSGRS